MPRLLRGRRRRLLLRLAVNGILQAGTVVAISQAVRLALDVPAEHAPLTMAWQAAACGAAGALAMALLRWRERIDAEALAQSYVFRVRTRLLDKLARLEPASLAGRGHGGLLLRFAGDLTALGQWIGRGVARILVSGIVIAAVLAVVVTFHWMLAATLGAGLALAAAAGCWRAPRIDAAVIHLRNARARLVTRINGTLNHLPALAASGELSRATALLGRRARSVRDSAVARARELAVLEAVAEGAAFAIPIAVVCAALAIRAHDSVSQGELVAVLGIALLVSGPVRELGRAYDYWRRARLSRQKIEQFLALPTRRAVAAPASTGP